MNILHLRYAVEIEKTKSISKAAENLYMGQPNLSRAIKELEESLGIVIFDRTSKGMAVTHQGEEFLGYAKKILNQIDEVESIYNGCIGNKQSFSVSVPQSGYISYGFSEFAKSISPENSAEIIYKEQSTNSTIRSVMQSEFKLGIIRHSIEHDKYYKSLLDEKGLIYEMICRFHLVLLMSEKNLLSNNENINFSHLEKYIEVGKADHFGSAKSDDGCNIRKISASDRNTQLEILSGNAGTYMWSSSMPDAVLEKWGLVQKKCTENLTEYKDVLIYRKDYRTTELDNRFINEIINAKRRFVK